MQKIQTYVITTAMAALLAACQTSGDGSLAKNSLEETIALGGVKKTNAMLIEERSKEFKRSYVTASGNTGVYTSYPDGRIAVDWGSGQDTGTYTIKGDKVCSTWKTIRDGKERCFVGYQMPDGTMRGYIADTMKYNSTATPVS